MIKWKSQLFYKGFVYKQLPFKQIETFKDIKPTHEEIVSFQQTVKKPTSSNLDDNNYEIETDDEAILTVL